MTLTEQQSAAIEVNRRQYEALKAAGQGKAPRSLPPLTARDATTIAEEAMIRRETIPGGWYWTAQIARGATLRLTNVDGNSCASVIVWSARDTTERINHADTIKVQWSAALRRGRVILSDMGRVLFSIVEDTSGAHDAIVGGSTPASNARNFGGDHRNMRTIVRHDGAERRL